MQAHDQEVTAARLLDTGHRDAQLDAAHGKERSRIRR
jgi:hypothetical protein